MKMKPLPLDNSELVEGENPNVHCMVDLLTQNDEIEEILQSGSLFECDKVVIQKSDGALVNQVMSVLEYFVEV